MAENTLNKLYELTEKMVDGLTAKGDLSATELQNAKCAVELMHKIRHFESDSNKYGWNEDGVSGKMYPPMNPNAYRGNNGYGQGSSGYYMHGGNMPRSHNDNWGYTYSGAKEHLIQEAEKMMNAAVNDEERMAIMNYINRLNG